MEGLLATTGPRADSSSPSAAPAAISADTPAHMQQAWHVADLGAELPDRYRRLWTIIDDYGISRLHVLGAPYMCPEMHNA